MSKHIADVFNRHADELKQAMASGAAKVGLASVLPLDLIQRLIQEHVPEFRSRPFPPEVTLWTFLSQVL